MLEAGKKVDDFELIRFPELAPVSSRELLDGGPLGILFAKHSCPTCRWAFPYLDRIRRLSPELASDRIFLVLQDDPETAGRVVDQYALETPVLLDLDPWPVGEIFRLRYVPDGFLLGSDGTVEVSFESFDRAGIEEISNRLRAVRGLRPAQLFTGAEEVPAFRPG